MEYNNRTYRRASHLHCAVSVSADGKTYQEVTSRDISSGGISILTNDVYQNGDLLFFRLQISGFMSEFTADIKGKVMRCSKLGERFSYGIRFEDVDEKTKVRIDESIAMDRMIEFKPYTPDK